MEGCGICMFAPVWESDSADAKGLCRWAEQFAGMPVPAGIKPWVRAQDEFSSFLRNLMHPVSRHSGLGCLAYKPRKAVHVA